MLLAQQVSRFSHDSESRVGSILVHKQTGAVLATGYNGFVRGADDVKLPSKRPEKYPYMIHSEQNLLLNAARHGVSTDNCYLVCTLSPCINCLRFAWQAGIDTIYFKEYYRDFKESYNMRDLSIVTKELNNGFTKIEIKGTKK